MIKALQNRHKIIWLILAFLVPLGFVSALLVIPEPASDDPILQESNDLNLPIKRTLHTDNFKYHLRQSEDESLAQLEVWIKKPLAYPSASISVRELDGDYQPLGMLGPKGAYIFTLPAISDQVEIILRDHIKDTEIERVRI